MSLKAFHLVFVGASVVLCGLVIAWGVQDFRHHGSSSGLTLATMCAVLGVGLMVYGVKVYRKFQELGR